MRFKLQPLILLIIIPLFNSCINNADFDQIEVDVDPAFNVPLIFFEVNQFDFLDDTNNSEIPIIADISEVDIFQTSTVRDNLQRVDLIVDIEKDFPRAFAIQFDLLNDADMETYSFQNISLPEDSEGIQIRENITIADNPNILNTTKMRIRINLFPSASTPIDPDENWKIEFRSVGEFYLSF